MQGAAATLQGLHVNCEGRHLVSYTYKSMLTDLLVVSNT